MKFIKNIYFKLFLSFFIIFISSSVLSSVADSSGIYVFSILFHGLSVGFMVIGVVASLLVVGLIINLICKVF